MFVICISIAVSTYYISYTVIRCEALRPLGRKEKKKKDSAAGGANCPRVNEEIGKSGWGWG